MTAALEDEAAASARADVLAVNAMTANRLPTMRPQLWNKLGWSPHPMQREILLSPTRQKVFAGGRRVGKSQTGGHVLVPYALSAAKEIPWLDRVGQRREYWIVGPEYSDAEKEFRVVYNALRKLRVPFDKPGTYNNPLAGEMHISLWDGRLQIHAKSSKYPGTLVGEGVSGIICSEAAKMRPSVWPKFLRPTLADFAGWAYFGSTPEGRNWFYDLWNAGQDPNRTDWASWRAPSWSNRHLFPAPTTSEQVKVLQQMKRNGIPITPVEIQLSKVDPEIVAMMLDLSEEMFNQEVAALFNEFVGRVFKDFDEEIHVGDFEYDPTWQTYAALDYGFTNPFVWLLIQIDPFGENIRVLDEYYEVGRTTEEACREIQARGLAPGSLIGFYPDPAEPDRSKQLSGLLGLRSYGGTGGALSDRLEWIRRKLKPDSKVAHLSMDHPEWTPQLMIHRRCRQTIREFNAYRYPDLATTDAKGNLQEAPQKKDDHTPEALGRFMVGHFGSPWKENAPARQSRARVGRRRR
jgi:hypothetical protein